MSLLAAPDVQSAEVVNEIISWAKTGGKIALGYFNNIVPQHKPDTTFVTQADIEIEQYLTEKLSSAFPSHCFIGEEGAKNGNPYESDYVWAIDPIDGTTVFVQGLPGWGISIGLLYRGQPCFGLFYMPLIDDLTYTTHQGQVRWNDKTLASSLRHDWAERGFLAVSSSAHSNYRLGVRRIRAMGSIAANMVYTARGAATATFAPKACIWDIAGGAAILGQLGGEVRYLSGQEVDYMALFNGKRGPESMLAGRPQIISELQETIKRRESAGL